jgi:hypothetical protein
MKKLLILTVALGFLATSCRKIEVDGGTTTVTPPTTVENTILEGRITTNLTLKASYTYKLRGLVYVTQGAILTIEPGTKIVGENGKNGALREEQKLLQMVPKQNQLYLLQKQQLLNAEIGLD